MTLFARAVFLVLVAATFAAFFVAQRLKGTPPVVNIGHLTRYFSPNGDGTRDVNAISFSLREADRVTASIVDTGGDEVKRLATDVPARPYRPVKLLWGGETDLGARAPDGGYRLRINLRREGRSIVVPELISLDTRPPAPRVIRTQPAVIGPQPEPVRIRVTGVSRRAPTTVRIVRTDVSPPQRVTTLRIKRDRRRAIWNGLVGDAPAPAGTYMAVPSVRDRAGNVGTTPARIPPSGPVPGKAGITVRTIAVQPPSAPVRAGERFTLFVDARKLPYSYRLRRVGGHVVARGRVTDGRARLALRAPGGISGVYLLQVRARRYSATVPVLVQSAQPAPLLVVMPTMTWLGLDPVDDDGDGMPNTLPAGGPVGVQRTFAGLPAGFADGVAPLLVALDRARVRYDIASDLELGRGEPLRAGERPGVLLPGPERWIPRALARRLRRYVTDGGRVASFGADTLRRGVTVQGGRLANPTEAAPVDAFGTRVGRLQRSAGPPPPLEPLQEDRALGLLVGTAGRLEGFAAVEESAPPRARRTRVLTAVGREVPQERRDRAAERGEPPPEPRPALAATRQGSGLVIRVGLPDWSRRIFSDADVGQITRNIVDILRGTRPRPRSPL